MLDCDCSFMISLISAKINGQMQMDADICRCLHKIISWICTKTAQNCTLQSARRWICDPDFLQLCAHEQSIAACFGGTQNTSLFWPYYPIIHNLCGRQIFIIPLKCHGNIHKVWRRHKRSVISVANVSYYKLKRCLSRTTNLNIHELVQHLLKQQLFCFVKICSLHTLFFQQNIEKML